MLKRNLVRGLVVLLMVTSFVPLTIAGSKDDQHDGMAVEKVKARIAKLCTGKTARVRVTLRDNQELAGYVSAVTDEGFVVVDKARNADVTVSYGNVTSIKGQRAPATRIMIWVGIGAGIVAVLTGIGIAIAIAGS